MKIFDIVFFYNEHELLYKRIDYLSEIVNHTIILNFGDDHIDIENVTVIPVLENFQTFIEKPFVKMIINFIGKKNISYSDKFIFSRTFEIPSLESLIKFTSSPSGELTLLNQEVYIHNIHSKSIYKHVGSVLSHYADLIQKNTIEKFMFTSNIIHYNTESFQDGGFCLLDFNENLKDSVKSLKYWFPDYTDDLSEKSLQNYRNKNLNLFSHQKPHVLLKSTNKELISFDIPNQCEQNTSRVLITFFYQDNFPPEYDKVFYITENNIKIEGISTWVVNKPEKIFYKSKQYFEDYKKNDILRCLRTLTLNDADEIHIKTKTTGTPVVFEYGFLKDSIPSEFI